MTQRFRSIRVDNQSLARISKLNHKRRASRFKSTTYDDKSNFGEVKNIAINH